MRERMREVGEGKGWIMREEKRREIARGEREGRM